MPKSRTKALIAVALFTLTSFLMLIGIDDAIAQTKVELADSITERVKISQQEAAVNASTNVSTLDQKQLMCLARNIYFESRGESERGMKAVAHVTLNRVRHRLFPNTVCGVVYQRHNRGCQFSWICDRNSDRIRSQDEWIKSIRVAFKVLSGQTKDPTYGATHYFNYNVVNPGWSRRFVQTATIGNHSFHKMS